ncbi:MAG: ATP synthase F1 subunit delta [Candidatus Aminicenantia bacterium]
MKGEAVAKRYALALIKLCKKDEDWERINSELKAMLNLISKNDELKKFIENPIFPKKIKINVIQRISEETKHSEKSKRFLTLLIERGRFSLLNLILKNFEDLWNKKNNIYKFEIISSVILKEDEKIEIIDALSKTKKGEIRANFSVDPKILGGIVIKEGNKILDCSLRGNFERLKNRIIEGEQYGNKG